MADKRQKRVADFIEPFRVKPGSKVMLGKDFDPRFKGKEEQRTRFLRRVDLPDHNWKFSDADVRERERWDDYQNAFSEMLSQTSTEWAPWHVIPADRKWFGRIGAGAVLVHTLMEIDPRFPRVTKQQRQALLEVKIALIPSQG